MNEKEKKEFLDACLYYHGEEESPYNEYLGKLFWGLERKGLFLERKDLEDAKDQQEELEEDFEELRPLFARITNEYIRGAFVLMIYQHPTMVGNCDFSNYIRYGEHILKSDEFEEDHYKIDGLPYCRFYHKEKTCPYKPGDRRATYWSCEQAFIKRCCPASAEEDGFRTKIIYPFALDFTELFLNPTPEKPFYAYLLATMYDQYMHWGGSKEGFMDWVKEYETTEP